MSRHVCVPVDISLFKLAGAVSDANLPDEDLIKFVLWIDAQRDLDFTRKLIGKLKEVSDAVSAIQT